jgi:hypothetical protein
MTKEMALRCIFLPIAITPSAIALHVLLGGTPPKSANLMDHNLSSKRTTVRT